jgi:hypothetical protein
MLRQPGLVLDIYLLAPDVFLDDLLETVSKMSTRERSLICSSPNGDPSRL